MTSEEILKELARRACKCFHEEDYSNANCKDCILFGTLLDETMPDKLDLCIILDMMKKS